MPGESGPDLNNPGLPRLAYPRWDRTTHAQEGWAPMALATASCERQCPTASAACPGAPTTASAACPGAPTTASAACPGALPLALSPARAFRPHPAPAWDLASPIMEHHLAIRPDPLLTRVGRGGPPFHL